jgi:cytochrome P450
VPRLKYSEAVIKEAMRLYPPVWVMIRRSASDQTVASWSFAKGAQVFLSQWVVHRDSRFYANPDGFKPDRWTEEFKQNLPKYAYFPFGGGPRVCIGQSFATLEILIVLATIFQNVRLTVTASQQIQPRPSLTLRPEAPIYMHVDNPAKNPA